MAAVLVACGKRGDPLPPLRPIPGPADGFTIRQVGDVIRLEWTAPSANQDQTTENVLLRDVDIRRRIIDLPALIEEQTKIIEPKDPKDITEPDTTEPDTTEPDTTEPDTTEPDTTEPDTTEPDTTEPDTTEPDTTEPETTEPDRTEPLENETEGETSPEVSPETDPLEADESLEDLGPPPPPLITITTFAPSSRPLVTLESTVLGERMSYDDPLDPAWIGQRVEYAVIYTNKKNRRGPPSTVLQIDPAETLPPPGAPVAVSDDLFVALSWPAPPDWPPPVETAPVETAPVETAPVETAPVETAPVETAPVETAPVETAPVETAPVETTPVEEDEAGESETVELDEEVVPEVPHYAVFRRAESDESYPDRPLNGRPIPITTYSDRMVAFEVPSCYIIRTVPPPPPLPVIIDAIEGTEELAPESELIDEPKEEGGEVIMNPLTGEPVEATPETESVEEPPPLPLDEPALPDVLDEEQEAEVTVANENPVIDLEEVLERAALESPDVLDLLGDPEALPVIIVPVAPPLTNEVRFESTASSEVCLTPVDTFALPPPTGLIGVSTGEAILLTWDESPRPDAAGYRIYRGESDNGPFELLNAELMTAPTYRDNTASAGVDYLYYVTAIDDAPAQNESEASEYDQVTLTPP